MSDNIITITDFMDPNLDVYARLTENQLINIPSFGLALFKS